MKSSLKTQATAAGKQSHRLMHRLKVARIMELPETEFGKIIHSIEEHPVYKRYFSAENPKHRLFGHRRFPGTQLNSSFLELNENITMGSDSVDLESFLQDKSEVIQVCQRIGQEQFEQYFLFNDGKHSISTIAETCGITPEEVRQTMDLINQVAIQEQFASSPMEAPPQNPHWDKIGSLQTAPNGQIEIVYSSLRYARGRYHIDYNRLSALRQEKAISRAEWNELNNLVRQMELVNARKATVCMILDTIIQQQKEYVLSQKKELLKPFNQADLAQSLGLHSSTISRAIANKSVLAPWREEVALKTFLVKGDEFRIKAFMEHLFQQELADMQQGKSLKPRRDDEIRDLIRENLSVRIATRTVAKYRTELKIENVYARRSKLKPPSTSPRESSK